MRPGGIPQAARSARIAGSCFPIPFLLLPILATLLSATSCASQKIAPIVTGEAVVALPAALEAPGGQQRLLPWAAQEREATARLALPFPMEANAPLSPGLEMGTRWLEARRAAQAELRRSTGELPAAEPPPGEASVLTLAQLAERRPGLRVAWEEALRGAEEERLQARAGGAAVRLRLPLGPLAEAVLQNGGGFSSDSALGRRALPETRAERQAAATAREELLRNLLQEPVRGEFTFYDWVRLNPLNQRTLQAAVSGVQVQQTTRTTTPQGKEGWRVVLEMDTTRLREEAAKDYDVWKRSQP